MSAPSPSPIRVAITNDHELVVAGLERMLAPFGSQITVCELDIGCAAERAVDITLSDTFTQEQIDGSHLDRHLTTPACGKVVVYSWNHDEKAVRTALDKGVRGYLSKALPAQELVAALEKVHAGEVVISPEPTLDAEPAQRRWPGQRHELSEREAEVVALITAGLSNEEIARRCFLSINSVKTYIRTAYRKMDVTSRSQAVLWGIEHGLRPRPPRRVLR